MSLRSPWKVDNARAVGVVSQARVEQAVRAMGAALDRARLAEDREALMARRVLELGAEVEALTRRVQALERAEGRAEHWSRQADRLAGLVLRGQG